MCFLSHSRIIGRLRSRSRAEREERGLCNLHTASVESIPLPATSVPHRDGNIQNHVLEDVKALRDIFTTPSSIRGYEAAGAISRREPSSKRFSSDNDLSRQTPTRSAKGKLGALGHAVKQKLSDSGLSKESSKTVLRNDSSLDSPERRGMVSSSYMSNGLTELLTSRTASEGGYDSDAKDISTPILGQSSNLESQKISPDYLSEAVCPQNSSSPKKTSSALSIPEYKSDMIIGSTKTRITHEEDCPHETAPIRTGIQELVVPVEETVIESGTTQQNESRKVLQLASQSLSEEKSIHLGDMQISQRLASNSAMPMTSLSSRNFGSGAANDDGTDPSPDVTRFSGSDMQQHSIENELPLHLHRQPSVVGRYHSFVTQEHNRKPSDPRTKRLFEDATDGSRLHPKWKSLTSANSVQGNLTTDDASSHFLGDIELADSGAASLTNITRSETITNINSLAVPGRRASAAADQGYGSFGHLSSTEQGACLGDARNKKRYSLRDSEDFMAPHDNVTEGTLKNQGCGGISTECRFAEERNNRRSGNSRRILASSEADEGMSMISDRALHEKRHERMSDLTPDAQGLGARPCRGSPETRSASAGWLTQGRRFGFGYDFIERTTSRQTDTGSGPRDGTATHKWDQALIKARQRGAIESSSKSVLNTPFWITLARRKKSGSNVIEQQAVDFHRPRSVASERGKAPSNLDSLQLDPQENHHRMFAQASRQSPTLSAQWSVKKRENKSSKATSAKESPRKKSFSKVRRHTIAGANDKSAPSAVALKDFPTWAKFPSHTRKKRCGPAGERDGITTRHFSPPTPDMKKSAFQSNLTIHQNMSASSYSADSRGSWRRRAIGHMRRKSKSMTFAWGSASPKHKAANRSLFWQLRNFYRSQSSDLRRLQAGHRSSVTLSRESKYPELDLPVGFGSSMPLAISPSGFLKTSVDEMRSSENMGEDAADCTKQRDTELWRTGTGISTGHETENCFPAGEAKRWSPPKAMLKTSALNGFDGTLSPQISEEHARAMTDSGSDWNSTQEQHGNGTHSSFVSVTAGNGFGNGSGDFGVQTHECRLASTELRDSTIDFRKALIEREQRSKDDLLSLAEGLDGFGEGDDSTGLQRGKGE